MVLIFSANANQSPQVRREVERAIAKSLPVLPLRIEDIRPQGALEFALSNTHWLDAFAAPADERFAQLAESVMALLGVKREKMAATQSVPVLPVVRKRRVPWLVATAMVVAALVGALLILRPTAEVDTLPVKTDSVSSVVIPVASDEDETINFQGHWIAVEESAAGHGRFSDADVAARRFRVVVQDYHFLSTKC